MVWVYYFSFVYCRGNETFIHLCTEHTRMNNYRRIHRGVFMFSARIYDKNLDFYLGKMNSDQLLKLVSTESLNGLWSTRRQLQRSTIIHSGTRRIFWKIPKYAPSWELALPINTLNFEIGLRLSPLLIDRQNNKMQTLVRSQWSPKVQWYI